MIVNVQRLAGGRIIEVIVGEKLSQEDYSEFVDTIEKAIAKWGEVRLLFEFREFHGWDLAAFWEDLKFDYKHFADFDRMAVVGDAGWEKWMTILCKPITKAKLKVITIESSVRLTSTIPMPFNAPTWSISVVGYPSHFGEAKPVLSLRSRC